ncbi:isochorismatase family protein [Croceicoccus ponticola]|uniref:Isochorismatase family protein n=1 Tax=Croceicoccus ponticola TaxID=2217664 RepID=A0A437H217_9SPHN|nr:isochorismatase family protein [Croceicoccus ponticola]RVQ69677.1 isochorismatase family protein [Croceicoccus ponticola]
MNDRTDGDKNLLADASGAALVIIDVQEFSVAANLAPHKGTSVLANSIALANACRAAGILVVIITAGGGVRLAHSPDREMPSLAVPPGSHRVPEVLGPMKGDLSITKYNWGAFFGTSLDLHLRRRGIDTIILCGIATNFGVESTARQAHERGYQQIIVDDAISAFSEDEHEASLSMTLRRISRVRSTREILEQLASGSDRVADQ